MTNDTEAFHLSHRREKMKQFIAAPQNYKVCTQCRSISFIAAPVCKVCHAYRWDETPEGVCETARIIGATAFPQTAGVVPRIKEISEPAVFLTRGV